MKKIFNYFKESKNELAKVIWPTKKETINMSISVAVISVIVAFFLWAVDLGLFKLLEIIL